MEKAIDPFTKTEFTKKRSNQRFSCRENQIKYNNIKAKKKRMIKAKVDKPLDKNRSILLGLLGDQKEIVKSQEWLTALGYDFAKYTHVLRHDNKPVQGVYEFIVFRDENNNFKIQRNERY